MALGIQEKKTPHTFVQTPQTFVQICIPISIAFGQVLNCDSLALCHAVSICSSHVQTKLETDNIVTVSSFLSVQLSN